MYKSKIGISVGLFGALVSLLGLLLGLSWPFLAVVAYILIREENEWLRRLTLKVLIFIIAVGVISLAVTELNTIIYNVIDIFSDDIIKPTWPDTLSRNLHTAIEVIADLVLLFMGLKALKQGHFSIKSIDDVITKNV